MLTKERESVRAIVSVRVVEPKAIDDESLLHERRDRADESPEFGCRLFEFAGNAPATFAERFPRLTVGGVALALIMATIGVEIQCLRGAGYFWQ